MILADHCVFSSTICLVRSRGFAITELRELIRPNVPDLRVLQLAIQHDLVLLTNDKGFGNIMSYPPEEHEGIVLLRITAATESDVHLVLLRLLQERTRDELRHRLAVVDRRKYRIIPRVSD
jgi:predicted nuclease of predicted toxin-antitoxin system